MLAKTVLAKKQDFATSIVGVLKKSANTNKQMLIRKTIKNITKNGTNLKEGNITKNTVGNIEKRKREKLKLPITAKIGEKLKANNIFEVPTRKTLISSRLIGLFKKLLRMVIYLRPNC